MTVEQSKCSYKVVWFTSPLFWNGGMVPTAIQVHAVNLIRVGYWEVAAHFEPIISDW